MALRFCLSGKGGFLPPADPSQPCTEQDSCLEGLQKCFISYLWPRFLHVPFLQVVSRKLWHQLEQPKRREKRAASDGGHWGGPGRAGQGWGCTGRKAHVELAPGPEPTRRLWPSVAVPLLQSAQKRRAQKHEAPVSISPAKPAASRRSPWAKSHFAGQLWRGISSTRHSGSSSHKP